MLAVALLVAVVPQASFAQSMTLPGKFSVATSGAATYNIPIAVPPGTAGLAPSLSLEYDSQGGNGLLGVGWSLGGLPSVGRCPRTLAQDGVPGGVNFDANDRFCLDGQRLVLVNGTYGADGAQYRTEVDTFSEIISHGTAGNGPAWFEVHTKSGQVMEFGHTTDSQVLAQGKTTARSWALDKLSDTKGNYFTVTYTNDTTNGQAYPIEIDYTGNAAASLSPNNKVQLVYATRSDITPQYQAGSRSQTTVRLTDVKTYSGAVLVADYKLSYQQSATSNRSELIAITLCGGDGTCLPPTAVTWVSDAPASFTFHNQTSTTNFGSPPSTNCTSFNGDYNNDGKSDFLLVCGTNLNAFLGNGDGTFSIHAQTIANYGAPPTTYCAPFAGDFNGDGKSDFMLFCGANINTFLGNGDGTFALHNQTASQNYGSPPTANCTQFSGDYNGDGRTDFVLVCGTNLNAFLSNGDGTFAFHNQTVPNYGSPPTNNCAPFDGDFDGDGKGDFMLFCGANINTYLSNGDGTFTFHNQTASQNYGGPPTANCMPLGGDYNGDGKTDVALVCGTNINTFLSKGDGTFSYQDQTVANYGSPPTANCAASTGDFDADGKSDLMLLCGANINTFLSNGNGTFALHTQTANANYGSPPTTYCAPLSGDIDGDGKSDFSLVCGTNINTFLSSGTNGGLVSSLSNGIGSTTSITYLPMTNGSVYTKDVGANAASYPVQDLQSPIYAVSQVSTSNGVGGTYSSNYSYVGAKLDLSGRGFLGFRQMTVKDPQTGIADVTNYLQAFPYLGLVSSTTRSSGSQTLAQSTNTFQFTNVSGTTTISPSNAPYQVSLSQNVSSGSDLDGSALPSVTTTNKYDALGNATQVMISTSDGYSKTTNNTYTNNTTNWYLGRLTQSSVTSASP